MKTLASVLALSLTLAFTATAFAATKPPHTKPACEKAHRRGMTLLRSAPRGILEV
jgi:hypothetical protein